MPESLHYPTNGMDGHPLGVSDARANAAANLRRIRTALGYSVYALAAKAGVSRATIDSIEGNRNAVGLDKLEAVAGALGLKAWELLRPPVIPAPKAVTKVPRPGRMRTTEAGSDLLQTLSVTSKLGRGAKALEEAPEDDTLSPGTNGSSSNRPRPKSGQKVAKTVKARTRP